MWASFKTGISDYTQLIDHCFGKVYPPNIDSIINCFKGLENISRCPDYNNHVWSTYFVQRSKLALYLYIIDYVN